MMVQRPLRVAGPSWLARQRSSPHSFSRAQRYCLRWYFNGLSSSPGCEVFVVEAKSLPATEFVASCLAAVAREGDTFLLEGDLGVGKSAFARSFIRSRLRLPKLKVPSPTFNLQITYEEHVGKSSGDAQVIRIHHLDLYRLSAPEDAAVLNLPQLMKKDICLIEWACRLGPFAPRRYVKVQMEDNIDLQQPVDFAEQHGERGEIEITAPSSDAEHRILTVSWIGSGWERGIADRLRALVTKQPQT